MWDFGKRSAMVAIQCVKLGPEPWSFQARILFEVITHGSLVYQFVQTAMQEVDRILSYPRIGGGTISGHLVPFVDWPDVAGEQWNRQTGSNDIKVLISTARRYEPHFHIADRHRIGRKEGINEISLKLSEHLGLTDDGLAVRRGMVVSPWRAPTLARALRGALIQDDDGCISKGRANYDYEHVADCLRYFGARRIKRTEIIGVAEPTAAPEQVRKMTVDEIRAAADNAALERARIVRDAFSRGRSYSDGFVEQAD
jgi:hypothetical protein